MADVNICSPKRKGSDEGTFDVTDDEVSIADASHAENLEPEPKMLKKDDAVDAAEVIVVTQDAKESSLEPTRADDLFEEKLRILEEENAKLREESEDLKAKFSNTNGDVEVKEPSEDVITIKFHDTNTAEYYKTKFYTFLQSIKEFSFVTENLEIIVKRNGVSADLEPLGSEGYRKRKRKKSKSKDLFVVDKTPGSGAEESVELKYVSKYTVEPVDENSTAKQKTPTVNVCFNCDKNHNLRDCPEPKDFAKINFARQKMKAQQVTKTRYHLDEDQKYGNLSPGKISDQLKDALGVQKHELPLYIYRMRRLGYPPGWMLDAKIEHSNLSLYDIEGKEDCNAAKGQPQNQIDPEKIIDYPGFNMPMEPGTRDDFRSVDCPQFSDRCSKEAMISFIKGSYIKQEDNNEVCDMDLDQSTDEVLIPPGCEEVNRSSPSLVDLEQKKMELLAELDNGGNSTDSEGKKDSTAAVVPAEVPNESKDSEKEIKSELDDESNKVESDNVKLSEFGTPIIERTSPYCTLPHPDKFSKDISPVINFENLPNTTGKYEQMMNVLQKVRQYLKQINDKS